MVEVPQVQFPDQVEDEPAVMAVTDANNPEEKKTGHPAHTPIRSARKITDEHDEVLLF